MRKFAALALIALSFLLPGIVYGADTSNGIWENLNEQYQENSENKKLLTGILNNRIYYNDTFDSDLRQNENSNAFFKTRLGADLRLAQGLKARTVIKFQELFQQSENDIRAGSASGGGDKSFENHGAFIDELVLNYDYKKFSAIAGKFRANFGDSWKADNGIWVNNIAESYEQSEKLGFGLIQRSGDRKTIGEYSFGFSAFTNDNKFLDNSIITKRDGVSKNQGRPGDARGLQSYVISTDIFYDFGNQEELSYHFSYLNLAVNERQNHSNIPALIDDQKAFALNMDYKYPINPNLRLKTFVEYVKVNNLDGDSNQKANFLTVNFTTQIYKYYSITLARALEKQSKIGQNGIDTHINEFSAAYEFEGLSPVLKGLSLSLGYYEQQVDNKIKAIKNKAFGGMIMDKIEF